MYFDSFTLINNHLKCCGDGNIDEDNYWDEEHRRRDANVMLDDYISTHFANVSVILVGDLNDLPFPDRQVLYDADPNLAAVGAKSFVSARGWPYKCSYCFNKQYNDNYKGLGTTLRVKSPELVVQEIEQVRNKYTLDTVTFTDDVFTLRPPGWIKEFSKLYKVRINLPFNCTARASSVKKDDIIDLKNAGLTHVWMGVECGDEEAANKVFLRGTTNESNSMV